MKAAAIAYSDTLRIELAPLGVKVVAVFIGEVATGLVSADNISFGHDSLYVTAEESVRERHRFHAKNSITPQLFAQHVVSDVLLKSGAGNPGRASIWREGRMFLRSGF